MIAMFVLILTFSTRLLSTTMELYRGGKITDIRPLKTFDISHITDAYRYFSSRNRMGKVAISVENADSIIKVSGNLVP